MIIRLIGFIKLPRWLNKCLNLMSNQIIYKQDYIPGKKKWRQRHPLLFDAIIGFIFSLFYILIKYLGLLFAQNESFFFNPSFVDLLIPGKKIFISFFGPVAFGLLFAEGLVYIIYFIVLIFIALGITGGYLYKLRLEKSPRFRVTFVIIITLFIGLYASDYSYWKIVFNNALRTFYYQKYDKVKFCESIGSREIKRFDYGMYDLLPRDNGLGLPRAHLYTQNHGTGKEGCFVKLAVDEQDESYCLNVPEKTRYQIEDRNECYFLTAIKKQSRNVCNLINDLPTVGECYFVLALLKNDEKFCDKIKDLAYKKVPGVYYADSEVCKSELKKRNL